MKGQSGRTPYLLRAVFPAFPGAPGCRHCYRVRLNKDGSVSVANPTLSRRGQCPVPMKRSAVVAFLKRPPSAVYSLAATLAQD